MDANMLERRMAAQAILDEFAASTGLTSSAAPRRYLWTDAFAVLTWLGLHEETREPRFLDLALRLVDQVHRVLGRHRGDDGRSGSLSGLVDAEAERHPTAGGLRIGKPLPERPANEPPELDLEWDRDGQYYHYLVRWIEALAHAARVSGEGRYREWAAELAAVAHRAFGHPPGSATRLFWKMSIDLSRPLVDAMGMHDALDGLAASASLGLPNETRDLQRMCAGRVWTTDDPLGAGGLLLDALRLGRLVSEGREDLRQPLARVLRDATESAELVAAARFDRLPAGARLAFRELGFAIGLHAAQPLAQCAAAIGSGPMLADAARLAPLEPHAAAIEHFWAQRANQSVASWTGHRDINAVMLAAALAPRGALCGQHSPAGAELP